MWAAKFLAIAFSKALAFVDVGLGILHAQMDYPVQAGLVRFIELEDNNLTDTSPHKQFDHERTRAARTDDRYPKL